MAIRARMRDSMGDLESNQDLEGGGGYYGEQQYDKRPAKGVDKKLGPALLIVLLVIVVLAWSALERLELLLALTMSIGALVAAAVLAAKLMTHDRGTSKMIEVATAIREGSNGFFRTQYTTIAVIAGLVAVGLFFGFSLRDPPPNLDVTPFTMGVVVTGSFVLGCVCSCGAGYIGLWVSVRTNVRVGAAARKSYLGTIQIALMGGAVGAIVVVALVVLGITLLYIMLEMLFVGPDNVLKTPNEVPLLMVGFGFGASFVALFAQLGGGIFTKAADVGADLVGKVEQNIPEDDPRNPAVIADLVGDNVGDCAGRGADLFESISAEIISAMILGGTMCTASKSIAADEHRGFILFPLVVHALDLVVSGLGVASVLMRSGNGDHTVHGLPLSILKRGYYVAGILATCGFAVSCYLLLNPVAVPGAWKCFFACGMCGMLAGWLSVLVTQYYTDTIFRPVRSIADASTTGHATNIIAGVSVGLESTCLPVLIVSAAIIASYWFGQASGLVDQAGKLNGGLFGTAVATMGMLSTAVYVLAMDFFGPIADNAGGIVEMSDQPARVRDITDMLDAVGNTTKAATKGFAIGSAALACFLLFAAFMDEVSSYGKLDFTELNVVEPEVLIAGLLGGMLVFLFSSWTVKAVGDTAQAVVEEVRRQFRVFPGIMTGQQKPDYKACVSIVAQASLRKMVKPGALAVLFPLIIGVGFRFLGEYKGDPLLGAKAVLSMLIFSTVSGILMSLFFNNAGGAWDNAKKLIETGMHGGKGSEAHKAAVTGDTVGDPFKDTAGPSLHVLIKLLSTITLVLCPLFVARPAEIA